MLITKCDDMILQSVTASFITKWDNLLLQSATAIFVLHSATSVITKCGKYYKVKQFYYKVRQVLQSAMIITKCDRTGACFSKVPKLFGRISGDIILFVSSKRRRLEARNFAVIFVFNPFTTYEKTSFTE